jgi:DNA polymerase (family 10)
VPRSRPSRIAAPSPVRTLASEDPSALAELPSTAVHDHDESPADVLADEAADLTNGDLARIFHEIGDILEVQGEIAFKTIAYHRAADTIGRSPIDLVAAYRSGEPPKVSGVGQAISDKIRELVTTGRMAYLERLRAEVPASLVELLEIPGLGPKTVRQLHEELGIETMDQLREAAAGGRIRSVRGLSERTEQLILEGIERLAAQPPRRLYLHQAEEHIAALTEIIGAVPGVSSIEPAGSYRRR